MIKVNASIGTNKYKTILQSEHTTFLADEPEDLGGTNLGPKPTEMLAGALAGCVAITVRMYADRKEWPLEDVKVEVEFDTESQPGTTIFRKKIEFVGNLTDEQKQRLYMIAGKCPVNKSLQQPIVIE